jgi:mannose-6-phosphate isomerase-like protein (cupin superfamily)
MRGNSPNLLDLDRFRVEVKRIDKPWGYELIYASTDDYCGKIIFVRAGEQLSLQFHREKDETIYIQSGRVEFEIGEPGQPTDVEVVAAGRSFHLKPGTVHRLRAVEDATLLEVSTPQVEDVVRLEDKYGRAQKLD